MKSKTLLFILVGGLFIGGSAVIIDSLEGFPNQETYKQNEIKPKLSMIEFTVEPSFNGNDEVKSSNYGFSVILPYKYEVSAERAFSKYYPDNESVSLGARDPSDESGVIYNVTIRFLKDKTLKQITDEEVSYLSSTLYDEKSKIIPKEVEVHGQKGYEYQYRNASGQDEIIRYYSKANLVYSIHAIRNTGTQFTPIQRQAINKVFGSFWLIN